MIGYCINKTLFTLPTSISENNKKSLNVQDFLNTILKKVNNIFFSLCE